MAVPCSLIPVPCLPQQPWSNGVVELDKKNGGDAPACTDETQQGASCVKRLSDDHAAANGRANLGRCVFADEAVPDGIAPTDVEQRARQEDVQPVSEQGRAIGDEVG